MTRKDFRCSMQHTTRALQPDDAKQEQKHHDQAQSNLRSEAASSNAVHTSHPGLVRTMPCSANTRHISYISERRSHRIVERHEPKPFCSIKDGRAPHLLSPISRTRVQKVCMGVTKIASTFGPLKDCSKADFHSLPGHVR